MGHGFVSAGFGPWCGPARHRCLNLKHRPPPPTAGKRPRDFALARGHGSDTGAQSPRTDSLRLDRGQVFCPDDSDCGRCALGPTIDGACPLAQGHFAEWGAGADLFGTARGSILGIGRSKLAARLLPLRSLVWRRRAFVLRRPARRYACLGLGLSCLSGGRDLRRARGRAECGFALSSPRRHCSKRAQRAHDSAEPLGLSTDSRAERALAHCS